MWRTMATCAPIANRRKTREGDNSRKIARGSIILDVGEPVSGEPRCYLTPLPVLHRFSGIVNLALNEGYWSH
jgi:hypothetical protein